MSLRETNGGHRRKRGVIRRWRQLDGGCQKPRVAWSRLEPEEAGRSLCSFLREGGPADTWASHFQPLELGENHPCCFVPPGFPSFVKAATRHPHRVGIRHTWMPGVVRQTLVWGRVCEERHVIIK